MLAASSILNDQSEPAELPQTVCLFSVGDHDAVWLVRSFVFSQPHMATGVGPAKFSAVSDLHRHAQCAKLALTVKHAQRVVWDRQKGYRELVELTCRDMQTDRAGYSRVEKLRSRFCVR